MISPQSGAGPVFEGVEYPGDVASPAILRPYRDADEGAEGVASPSTLRPYRDADGGGKRTSKYIPHFLLGDLSISSMKTRLSNQAVAAVARSKAKPTSLETALRRIALESCRDTRSRP